MPDSTNRRATDVILANLESRLDYSEEDRKALREQLTLHITECSAMQKKVFGVMVFLAGWVVAHSPEAEKLIIRLMG